MPLSPRQSHVTKIEIANNRLIPNAIEPRAAIGEYDRGSGGYTLYTTSQNPHVARLVLSAFIGIAPEHKLRVIAPDVGGAFGSKIFIYAEEVVCVWASRKVGRPVKWVADRSESFLADAHGRDHLTVAEAAMDETGKILAVRVKTKANLGAYLSTFASSVPTYLYAPLLSGQYDIPSIYCEVDAVYTNTAPVDAYRGAGRPEATFVIERLVEVAARQLGKDPAEFRMHNFISVVPSRDAGDHDVRCPATMPGCMKQALELADYAGFAQAQSAKPESPGSCAASGSPPISRPAASHPRGRRFAWSRRRALGVGRSAGQSRRHRRSAHREPQSRPGPRDDVRPARVASLGIPLEQISIVHGDTDKVQMGMGTYGSRSGAVGMTADRPKRSTKSSPRRTKVAARCMEVADDSVDFRDGVFSGLGTNKSMTWSEVALQAYVAHKFDTAEIEPGLKEGAFYDPTNFTFPAGVHIAEVEIDPETGVTRSRTLDRSRRLREQSSIP